MSDVNLDNLIQTANCELEKASVWFRSNKLTLNVKKTKFMVFSDQNLQLGPNILRIGDQIVDQVGTNCKQKYFRFVGHVIDDKFTWEGHVDHIAKKLASANFAINSTKNFLPLKIRKTIYYSLFDSHLNFGNLLWGCANKKYLNKIENLQKRCIRNVALKGFCSHTEPIFKQFNILTFADKLSYCRAIFMHKYRNNKLPVSFSGKFKDASDSDDLQTRHTDYNYSNEPAIKRKLENFPFKKIITNWNALDVDLKSTAEEAEFEILLKEKLLCQYSFETDCLRDCYTCYGS